MRYEYKEKIKEDLEYSLEGVSIDYYSSEELIHKQKVKELDNVYAQAAKAGEYEAKAKAFDELQSQLKEGKPYNDGYMGWVSSQSYNGALRNVLELTEKLKDKHEDELDDGW